MVIEMANGGQWQIATDKGQDKFPLFLPSPLLSLLLFFSFFFFSIFYFAYAIYYDLISSLSQPYSEMMWREIFQSRKEQNEYFNKTRQIWPWLREG